MVKIKLLPEKVGSGCAGIALLFFNSFLAACAGSFTLHSLSALSLGLIYLDFSTILMALLGGCIAAFPYYLMWGFLCLQSVHIQWCINHQEITRKVSFLGFHFLNVEHTNSIQQLILTPSLYIGTNSEGVEQYSSPYVALRFSKGYGYKIADGVDMTVADIEYLAQIMSDFLKIPVTETNNLYFNQLRESGQVLMTQSIITFHLKAFKMPSDFLILSSVILGYLTGIAISVSILASIHQ